MIWASRSAAVVALAVLSACGGASTPSAGGAGAARSEPPPASTDPFVGAIERDAVERDLAPWREAREQAQPDPTVAAALARVAPGAEVRIYLGTWCGDSRREVPRLWKAFDLAGELPFRVTHVGVDRSKEAPGSLLDGVDLEYVPTIVVLRDGREVGRIVESAPGGVERALLDLLEGRRSGVITGRTDL